MVTKKITLNELRQFVKEIIKEEQGKIYSSDDMFEVKVHDMDNKLVATKKIRAKNSREAKEIFEDDYLDDLKEKHGTDLRYKINLAENKINKKVIKEEKEQTPLEYIKYSKEDKIEGDNYKTSYYAYDKLKKKMCIITFPKYPDTSSWQYNIEY